MSSINHRKCSKCGKTHAEDLSVTLHRFPFPGTSNIVKARAWATYCWPTEDWSYEALCSLHKKSCFLCGRHFSDSQFYDNNRQHLSRFAVPDSPEVEELLNNRENIFDPNKEQDKPTVKIIPSYKPVDGQRQRVKDPLALTHKEQIKLEVCIDSLESAVNAIHGGADELELCSALNDGGLTPSVGLVKEVLKLVSEWTSQSSHTKTKVNVMLRCRGGDDFQYTPYEMSTMFSDLKIFKDMGVDRFVFGALTDTLAVDEELCKEVLLKAQPIPVTFHRAFDLCVDPIQSIQTIIKLGFDRLLTSGQKSSAGDSQAIKLIRSLMEEYGEDIDIMPGSGVNCNNVRTFVELGCCIVHSSCKKNRILPKVLGRDFTMGGTNEIYVTDESIVKKMKEILRS